ncbi:hypothetical protein [Phormidium sp. CCY1219]|uniref:hypothetical protein n=1 Tax=Phormidium sp. CCY1219 TaxID=2886104 RepID=UPI002D76B36C|nr:hypothetical protein [Phormidium sp. CCY1219]
MVTTYIHVNRNEIRQNNKGVEKVLLIRVKRGNSDRYGLEVEIAGQAPGGGSTR